MDRRCLANNPRSWYDFPTRIPSILLPTATLLAAALLLPAYILTSVVSVGVDARFPNTNQTKHCWQNYVDYHKCILAKGEDFPPCRQVRRVCEVEK